MHQWPCLLAMKGFGGCGGVATFHHVRFCGSPKNDERGLMLCVAHHLHDGGKDSIERGKALWAARFNIDLEEEMRLSRRRFVESGGVLVSETA